MWTEQNPANGLGGNDRGTLIRKGNKSGGVGHLQKPAPIL